MGQKSSKPSGQWPPYGYQPNQNGPGVPFFPPGFPPPTPGQPFPGMPGQQPVIPQMYPPFFFPPPPPSEKGLFGWKKKRKTQSEQFPYGYFPPPFPQPQPAPPPKEAPEKPARTKTRKRQPAALQMPEPVVPPADTSFDRPYRSATPFGQQPPENDSDETSDEGEEEEELPRRRSRRASHRRETRSEEFLPRGPSRNPLPPPPKDVYEKSEYQGLASLPRTTALISAIETTQNPIAAATVTHLPAVPPPGQQPAPNPPPDQQQPKKKKSLFRRLTTSKKTADQNPTPQPQPQPAPAAQIVLPVSSNATFLPAIIGQAPVVSGGDQTRATTSTVAPAPTPAPEPQTRPQSQYQPQTPSFRPDTARFSDEGMPSAQGTATGGFPTSTSSWPLNQIPPPPPSPQPDPNRNRNPNEPYFISQADPEFAPFMNHAPLRVIYRNQIYPTATHLYEAMKYIDTRPDLAEQIRRCEDVNWVYPMSAGFHQHERPDWGRIFLDKMEEVMVLKFCQHDVQGKELIGTYPRPLVYADENDPYWGLGPDGRGENQLGKLFMSVRAKLMEDPDFQDWMERYGIQR